MRRRPPSTQLTDTLFPYTTLFRSIPVQIGGGIRDLGTIERYLDAGVSYVIIGTAAVKDPGYLRDACSAFPGHIIVGLDAPTARWPPTAGASRSEEHTSELQSIIRNWYAVLRWKTKHTKPQEI